MSPSEVADPADQAIASPVPLVPSAILSRLRLETRAEHEAVEQVLDLMNTSLTRDGYRQRLQQFYGFYAPLESALRARCDLITGQDGNTGIPEALAARLHKTADLYHDLAHLGVMAEGLPLCCELPPLRTAAEILGCVYVLEGATLGGQMITRHVQATFGITPGTGGRFFDGYGPDTGKMWQSMRQVLVSGAPDLPTENAMVTSAMATFVCLRRWCESWQQLSVTAPANAGATRHA